LGVPQRELRFDDFPAVLREIDRLQQSGYERGGVWDLAQACDHLTYFIQGSLDGHQFKVPWLIKVLLGRFVLRRILSQGRMKSGVFTPQKPLPAPGLDESAAVTRFRQMIERLDAHQGELHASPFFGYLTPDEWRRLHLIHCAHHLNFLTPKE